MVHPLIVVVPLPLLVLVGLVHILLVIMTDGRNPPPREYVVLVT